MSTRSDHHDIELLSDINLVQNMPLVDVPNESMSQSKEQKPSADRNSDFILPRPYKFRDREIMSKFARSDNDFKDAFRMSKKAVWNLAEKGFIMHIVHNTLVIN